METINAAVCMSSAVRGLEAEGWQVFSPDAEASDFLSAVSYGDILQHLIDDGGEAELLNTMDPNEVAQYAGDRLAYESLDSMAHDEIIDFVQSNCPSYDVLYAMNGDEVADYAVRYCESEVLGYLSDDSLLSEVASRELETGADLSSLSNEELLAEIDRRMTMKADLEQVEAQRNAAQALADSYRERAQEAEKQAWSEDKPQPVPAPFAVA